MSNLKCLSDILWTWYKFCIYSAHVFGNQHPLLPLIIPPPLLWGLEAEKHSLLAYLFPVRSYQSCMWGDTKSSAHCLPARWGRWVDSTLGGGAGLPRFPCQSHPSGPRGAGTVITIFWRTAATPNEMCLRSLQGNGRWLFRKHTGAYRVPHCSAGMTE